MTTPVIELEKVAVHYGNVHAIEELDLRLAEGETLGLLGHNGAGKTTTIKLILGIIEASAGRVRVFGHAPHERAFDALRFHVGFLPENVTFYDQMTGREVLYYFARLKRAAKRQADDLIEQVGLTEASGRKVKTYSKGMRQRLGLAQALLGEPRLLLLDEPTVGLDPIATRDFYETIDGLRRTGVSVILCSHVLPGIERHIDRVAILGEGRLLAAGTLAELRSQTGLPHLIRVRGTFDREQWQDRLASQGITDWRINGTTLEVGVAEAQRFGALRLLLADPGIEDVDVETPTLERIYAHFTLREARQEATA